MIDNRDDHSAIFAAFLRALAEVTEAAVQRAMANQTPATGQCDNLLTESEVIEKLGISRGTWRTYATQVPHIVVGSSRRYAWSDVLAFFAAAPKKARETAQPANDATAVAGCRLLSRGGRR